MSSENKAFHNIDPKCVKHSSKIPSALNATILDYYHQYGQNRDLEKYLRFRRSYNRSSSGSSIQLSPPDEDQSSARVGKSLENLSIMQSCLETEKNLQKSKSNESLTKKSSAQMSKTKGTPEKVTSDENATGNQVKLTSTKVSKLNKKYNINMDTSIEITFPQPTSVQSHQQQISSESPVKSIDFSQQKIEFGTSETQTEKIEFPKTPNRSEFDTTDMPARPSSVASSAASISNKQRLEWDSMADIGYIDKATEMGQLTNLTEFERRALKKFFAARGVSFDDEVVVFASKSKIRSTSVPELAEKNQAVGGRNREKWEVAFLKVLEEKYQKKRESSKGTTTVDGKTLWGSALKKFREKYGTKFNPESDLCITDPTVHSTPILPDAVVTAATGAIPKVRNKLSDVKELKEQREEIADKQRTELIEKACQTSLIAMSSKECQVEQRVSDPMIGLKGLSTTDTSKESEKSGNGKGLISAGSFEFFAPEAYNIQNKEIPTWNKENCAPQEICLAEVANKENIPPKSNDDQHGLQKPYSSIEKDTSNGPNSTDEIFGKISNLESDLTKGVEMLCSLADSKEFDEEKKKKLVRKMIRRMIKAKYNDSTPSSQSIISSTQNPSINSDSSESQSVVGGKNFKPNISGIAALSRSSTSMSHKESSISSAGAKGSVIKQSNSNENSMKDWLQPMTTSERNHQRKQLISKQMEMDKKLVDAQRQFLTKSSSNSENSKFNSNVLKFVQKQRNSQLDWLDKEICHLVNLKEFLNQEKKKREMDIMKDIVSLDLNGKQNSSARTDQSKDIGVIYENIVRPRSAKSHYAEVRRHSNDEKLTNRADLNAQTTNRNSRPKENSRSTVEKDAVSNASSSLEWNSHINMQQIVRNRTKLQTPNDDVVSYAHAKQQEFIGKYESIRARPIYTQPYSSDNSEGHYSEPRDNDRKTSSKKTTNDLAYTGSDAFLSSDSVSIAVANSTSNTTTHQYDAQASVGIQTSSSLTRTAPIFNVKNCCKCKGICSCANARRPTIRVKTQTNDKQLQVIPKAISYDLTFKEMKKQRADNIQRMENSLGHSETSSASSSKNSKKNVETNFIGDFGGCAKLSLQDHLKSARPDFVSHADERRKCLIELHHLREKRNEQRNRLFLLSSNCSLRNHVNSLNPQPMAVKRIFTTKGLRQQTRNRYNKLPEIMRKDEIDRQNRIKRSNRVIRDMFNKNLQKRVLKGQTDLSNSVSVAAV